MFLWRWKSSIIARNSIWNILFPDQSIKKGRRGRKRDKETRKNPEKDERYKENGLVKNTLSLVWNCEFKRSVFWMIVEYRMVFKQIGIIFPILWVQYKLGRKCVKRHPLFRLIICTLVKIAKERKTGFIFHGRQKKISKCGSYWQYLRYYYSWCTLDM